MDINSMFGANRKIVEEELARRNEEYHNDEEIQKIAKQFETEKIEFNIKVYAGPCPRTVALNAAAKFRATWVILDRQIKQDKKYFLEELSCSTSKMKRNKKIVLLRGPKAKGYSKLAAESTVDQVTYGEMLLGSPGEEQPLSKEENATNSEQATEERSPFFIADNQESSPKEAFHAGILDEQQTQQSNKSDWTEGYEMEEEFDNHMCSICQDRRPKIGRLRDFTYAELQAATNGFSQKNYISEGGLGSVYRGELQGLKIAVKQHKNASLQGEKEFKSEVHVLSKARHKNLVRLSGSCSEGSHRLLGYEYVCYGSLDQHLSRHNQRPPNWERRMRIARGAAKGLQYLHENKIIQRDMRPNSILITHDHEALARPLLKEKNYPLLVDPKIMDSHDFYQLIWMVLVAQKCFTKDPKKRLTMERVVEALDYIIEKNPTCGIKVYSPVDSDLASSMPGSCESEVTTPDISESQCEDGSLSIGPTASISSTSQMSITLSSSPPPQTSSSSSSSLSTLPEQSTLGGQKRRENESEVSQNKSGLRYDEMLMYI